MLKSTATILIILCIGVSVRAQNTPAAQQPNVRVNYLNVCSPSETEQKEIAAALSLASAKPSFAADFEVARGRSVISEQPSALGASTLMQAAPVSSWVRIRHDFVPSATLSNAQYSFSMDEQGMTETLVLRTRDASKSGVLQLSIQDSVTSGSAAAVLATNTPADRIRVERSGKGSLVLARCAGADQARYEPLFRTASQVMMRYREALDVAGTVPSDLARLNSSATAKKKSRR